MFSHCKAIAAEFEAFATDLKSRTTRTYEAVWAAKLRALRRVVYLTAVAHRQERRNSTLAVVRRT